jgi:hypothetical protein
VPEALSVSIEQALQAIINIDLLYEACFDHAMHKSPCTAHIELTRGGHHKTLEAPSERASHKVANVSVAP